MHSLGCGIDDSLERRRRAPGGGLRAEQGLSISFTTFIPGVIRFSIEKLCLLYHYQESGKTNKEYKKRLIK